MSASSRTRKRVATLRRLGSVAVLRIRPGDTIVLTTPVRLSREQVENVRAAASAWAGGVRVVVLDDGMQMAGVLRGGLL